MLFVFLPLCSNAQQPDSLKLKDTLNNHSTAGHINTTQGNTAVDGTVVDAATGKPLSLINISFTGSRHGTSSDKRGQFALSAPGAFTVVKFSYMGYQPVTKTIEPNQVNHLKIQLRRGETQLKEVSISSKKSKPYRNKGNPAVELIQQVINHKDQNRMESADYIQYDQYDRIGMSVFDLPKKLVNSRFFDKYRFMLDTVTQQNGQKQTVMPVYIDEKFYHYFYRKDPEKTIQVLEGEKGINIVKFVDTVGVDIYLNRLYGNTIDIYTNNIFVVNNQFLSPIADHAPDFYKFFIADTIQVGKQKLVELNFTPRNKGDLLFEGKLLVTLDGRYAVASCELEVNKQININFMRTLKIDLDFKPDAISSRYFLVKSDVKADFGILRNKGMGVTGERTVVYSNYKLNAPLAASFYQGKSLQTTVNSNQPDTGYWSHHRTDTLTRQQSRAYAKLNRISNMSSFKTATWIASTLTGSYADLGKVQIGPIGALVLYNNQEGVRFQLGGRTTPKFNKIIYLEGYAAYGTRDKRYKVDFNTYFSLNKTAPYRFPNDYFKISYLYDIDLPGQTFAINTAEAALSSFYTGKTDYWLYNKIFSVAYIKDFENHFSYTAAFRNWNQQAAGTLVFAQNDRQNTLVNNLTVSQFELGLRYAPHEQIIQGTQQRYTIYSKYPILNLQINHGFAGLLNGSYNYTNISANIGKRLYMSQLGYADVTLLGGLITGKVPFPLLNISPANQSIAYDPNAYSNMDYLEFVSDHYVGFNYTQSFNGFFLNKIPLVEHLKWREYLSFKLLYGGLRKENDPLYTPGLYQFPTASNGANGTYALGNTPYVETGAGIGNIFKILRVDLIRRFNYLDHPGISPYRIKLSANVDL